MRDARKEAKKGAAKEGGRRKRKHESDKR